MPSMTSIQHTSNIFLKCFTFDSSPRDTPEKQRCDRAISRIALDADTDSDDMRDVGMGVDEKPQDCVLIEDQRITTDV